MKNASIAFNGNLYVWQIVIAVCAVIFIAINYGQSGKPLARAVRFGCYDRERIRQGQWWRLVTVGFTHIKPWHIAMNVYALYNLRYLEKYFGHLWFAVILFGSVAGGSLLEYAISRTRYSVGLSGGLYGLMFSYFVLLIRSGSYSGFRSIMTTLLLNLAINFMPGIAWQAHAGGAVTGTLLTLLFLQLR